MFTLLLTSLVPGAKSAASSTATNIINKKYTIPLTRFIFGLVIGWLQKYENYFITVVKKPISLFTKNR
jgi:hypothetical protein